jgi:hypothetical protein
MKKSTLPPLIFGFFSLACLLYVATAGAQSAVGPKRLFDPVGAEKLTARAKRVQSEASTAAVREQEIRINLGAADFAEARELSLPLFGGLSYTAVRSESEGFAETPGGGLVWRGKIFGPGRWSGDVTLSFKGRALSGLVYSPEGVYEIVPQKDFAHLLVQIDQSLFPACGGALDARAAPDITWEDAAAAATPTVERSPVASGASAAADDGRFIDVLVAYTAAVRTSLGGTTQAEAFAQEAVNMTNTAYINSDIHTRLRLAGTLEVPYAETGDLTAALTWAAGDATVFAARNSTRADMVSILVQGGTACGVGYLLSNFGPSTSQRAFSAVARNCAVGNLSFAHELGHNQGCHHNPENGGPPESLAYPYGYGHYVDHSFRTVMSYSDPCTSPNFCPRVAYFSNPSVNFNGVLTGIPDQRDNHRVINNTATGVAQFRESFIADPPANDNFANASAIGGATGTLLGSNNGGTKEAGEPNHGFRTGGASVWYSWQAPASGAATITTAESNFNTALSVYTGGSVGGLNVVAFNDDVTPLVVATSGVTFNATAGTNYRIGVDGVNGVTGNLTLNWKMALPADAALLNSDYFVRRHYFDFLGREPDAEGLGFWTNEIEACGGDAQCREVKRVNVSAAFFLSIESQETGYLVYRLRQSSFGTRPTFAPFMADARQVAQGLVVGRAGWQDRLEANKAAFVEVWVQRPAFLVEFPAGMTAQEYVAKLSQRAGVTLTGAESQAAVSAYGSGDVQGRARALRAVVESQTVTRAHRNAAYVLMEYFGYLRRDPDEEGFQFWLTKLNAFNGDAVAAEMVKAFITSVEYRQRFGS